MVDVIPCTPEHFAGILELQRQVHRANVSPDLAREQGFVSWLHTVESLSTFNAPVPHTVAVDEGGRVVAYALSMDPGHRSLMPEAEGFVTVVEQQEWRGTPVGKTDYVCMGQVAVAGPYRGTGLFRRLYEAWFEAEAEQYVLGVTEIAASNTRSWNAHSALGWEAIGRHHDGTQEWIVVGQALR